jgi:glycosyltransferase involved in cell wall biosynthesis
MPTISVVVPTHNRPVMLAEAIASVRNQTFTDFEVIVVSNGESAEMRRASREAAAGCIYFTLDEGNVSLARNFGVAQASGEWIAFLDDDDIWMPAKLERQLAAANCTGADLVSCDTVWFFPDGAEKVARPRVPAGWSYAKAISHHRWHAIPSASLVRRRVFDNVGGFDPNLSYIEDTDLWHRVSWNHAIHQMDEVLCRYRSGHLNTFHPQNLRTRALWELRHFRKMLRVTPQHLRPTLVHFATFAIPRLAAFGPRWVRWLFGPHPRLRPRTRLIRLKRSLSLRLKPTFRAVSGCSESAAHESASSPGMARRRRV